jgi:glyoxylase-like metal-dependent hydrolase (beta-lactamase superfamily II)
MIYRSGTEFVNFYVLEEDGAVTVVDAGMPSYIDILGETLRGIGLSFAAVRGVVLTHVDPDHVGFAANLQSEHRIPVFVHHLDADRARAGSGKRSEEPMQIGDLLEHGYGRRVAEHFATTGGVAVMAPIQDVTEIGDGDELPLPGRLRVVHTPGHSDGHCVFVASAEDAIFIGDALTNRDLMTGEPGPRVPGPAGTVSTQQARESLVRLEVLPQPNLYFGHGDPWNDGTIAAVVEARKSW